mmetsp:Transcript_56748/g.93883  ORF Transcript_56748/g.93883 Transcript_56748/m.93883 type:complete len:273 (-) Transcript_56748:268-1086(-)
MTALDVLSDGASLQSALSDAEVDCDEEAASFSEDHLVPVEEQSNGGVKMWMSLDELAKLNVPVPESRQDVRPSEARASQVKLSLTSPRPAAPHRRVEFKIRRPARRAAVAQQPNEGKQLIMETKDPTKLPENLPEAAYSEITGADCQLTQERIQRNRSQSLPLLPPPNSQCFPREACSSCCISATHQNSQDNERTGPAAAHCAVPAERAESSIVLSAPEPVPARTSTLFDHPSSSNRDTERCPPHGLERERQLRELALAAFKQIGAAKTNHG